MSKLYKRVAVLLTGELRTWKYSSKYLINGLNDIADQVDWFLATWDLDESSGKCMPITDQDVLAPFKENGVNPKNYKILPIIGKQRTTFYNNAWLAKVANILKREVECEEDFVYDNVIESRVDLFPIKTKSIWYKPIEFEIVGIKNKLDNGITGSTDTYFRMCSYTNDILDNRYSFRSSKTHYTVVSQVTWMFNNHHWVLTQYIKNRMLDPSRVEDFESYPLRDNFPVDKDLTTVPADELRHLFFTFERPWSGKGLESSSELPWDDF